MAKTVGQRIILEEQDGEEEKEKKEEAKDQTSSSLNPYFLALAGISDRLVRESVAKFAKKVGPGRRDSRIFRRRTAREVNPRVPYRPTSPDWEAKNQTLGAEKEREGSFTFFPAVDPAGLRLVSMDPTYSRSMSPQAHGARGLSLRLAAPIRAASAGLGWWQTPALNSRK